MKKVINKSERQHILFSIVADSAARKAQEVTDTLIELRKQLHSILLENWQDNFPGISRQDQLALLQTHGAHTLTFKPKVFTQYADKDTVTCVGEFGVLNWVNSGASADKERIALLASRIFQRCTGTAGVLSENVSSGYTSYIQTCSTFPDLIHGKQPAQLYDASADLPKEFDPVLNDALMAIYVKIHKQLNIFKELVYSAEDAYQSLAAAIAPVKTAQQLAELMPEAVKHFPASLTYVKPTKEIADPKAINEIRAKLAKGLPI